MIQARVRARNVLSSVYVVQHKKQSAIPSMCAQSTGSAGSDSDFQDVHSVAVSFGWHSVAHRLHNSPNVPCFPALPIVRFQMPYMFANEIGGSLWGSLEFYASGT